MVGSTFQYMEPPQSNSAKIFLISLFLQLFSNILSRSTIYLMVLTYFELYSRYNSDKRFVFVDHLATLFILCTQRARATFWITQYCWPKILCLWVTPAYTAIMTSLCQFLLFLGYTVDPHLKNEKHSACDTCWSFMKFDYIHS